MTTQQEALTPIMCTTQSDDYSNANAAVNQVSGRVLLTIRVLWISVAVVTIALFAVAIPLRYKQYGEICVQQGCNWWHLSPHTLESLHMMGVSLARYKLYGILLESFTSATFVGIALLIFWRKSTEWIALLVSLWLVTFGTTDLLLAVQEQHPIWNHTANFLDVLGWVFLLPLFLFLFTDGRFVPCWTRWLLVGTLGLMAFLAFFIPQQVNSTTSNLTPAMFLWFSVQFTGIGSQVYRYFWISDSIQRQQTRWVVFGLIAVVAIILTYTMLQATVVSSNQAGLPEVLGNLLEVTFIKVAFLMIPLTMGISILRYRLWNIDIIINRTLVYGSLTALVVGVYILFVGLLASLFQASGNLLTHLTQPSELAVRSLKSEMQIVMH